MAHILIIGGGVSGCTAANELAGRGHQVTIIEKADHIGGKAREFGCKASAICNNCGVCLTGGVWEAVESNDNIKLLTNTQLVDVLGRPGNFSACYDSPQGRKTISKISAIIVAVGFERATEESFSSLEFTQSDGVISGFEIEKLMAGRTSEGIFSKPCSSVAFLQCFGSRDVQEKALYCSRVCCAYATRAAKALKYMYPDIRITFFHMDMQYIKQGQYYDEMRSDGIEFIKCKPVMLRRGNPAAVIYEDPQTGVVIERSFDLIVLSEGMRPPADAEQFAELCMLGYSDTGFLKCVRESSHTGIYLIGCACGPKRIEECHSEAITTANRVMDDIGDEAGIAL